MSKLELTPLLLTVEEAAACLRLGRTRTFDLIARGEIESVRVGRSRRVPVEALDRYVAQLRAERPPPAASYHPDMAAGQ